MCIERDISDYLLRCAKFEFFLINKNKDFAKTNNASNITGINWEEVGTALKDKVNFFESDNFKILIVEPPRFLIYNNAKIEWKERREPINSWQNLLKYGLAQLRNNIAHGSKAHPAAIDKSRVAGLISAGNALMDFIAKELFNEPNWCSSIEFK